MKKTLLRALPMLFVGLASGLQMFYSRPRRAILLMLLTVAFSAARGQIYVSTSGNDVNDGKTPGAAKATLTGAIAAIGTTTVPYIKLGAGTFDLTTAANVPANVRVVGEGANQTILNVISGGINLQSGSALGNVTVTRQAPASEAGAPTISLATNSGSNGITIKNVRFVGNRTAIYLQGSNHIITDNEFENNRTGLVIDPLGNPSITGLVLERNRFYRNRSYGAIFLGGLDNNTNDNAVTARIAHNDFIGNLAGGIELNVENVGTAVTLVGNYFDQTNNAVLNQRTNGGFTVDDHNVASTYPYNFVDGNGVTAPNYPNAVAGAATDKITVVGSLNKATLNGFSYANSAISSTSPAFLGYLFIKDAVDYSDAGATINVVAGTYIEKIAVNKQLTILGPNAGIEGKSGSRVAEAKIIPPATDLSWASTAVVHFAAGSGGSVFDGFEVNGDNPGLSSTVETGEIQVDASFGIRLSDAGNIHIKNNLVQNFGGAIAGTDTYPTAQGILAKPTGNNVYSGILIEQNYVKNIDQGSASAALSGIYAYSNAYAQIKNNKVENVRTGIQFDNPNTANPDAASFEAAIEDNEIKASRIGVWYNLAYGAASPWYVRKNNISPVAGVSPTPANFVGIRIESIQGTYSGYLVDNTIDGTNSSGIVTTGLWFNNNVNTTGTLLFKDNKISNVTDGIVYNSSGTAQLTAKVRFVGGEINTIANNYVRYIIPSGTPTFADINLPSTKLDGKTGEEWNAELGNLTTIYDKITDKDDDSNFGKVNLLFNVNNLTQGTAFATIQEAIDDTFTQNGDVIDVKEGTYTLTAAININKQLTLQGNSLNLSAKPVITGTTGIIITTGDRKNALIEVDAPNVKIQNFEFQINQEPTYIGISSTTTDNFNNLEISDNVFKGTKTQTVAGYAWYSQAIRLGRGSAGISGGVPNNLINIVRNTVTYANVGAPELFGRGIYAFNTYGKIGGSDGDKNTIAAVYALQGGELGGGVGKDFEFSYNDVQVGVVSAVGAEVGNHKLSNNNIGYDIPGLTQANGIVRLLEIKGSTTANANIEVSGNTISRYANIGIFVQRSNNVTIKGNTLTPIAGATAFNSIVFSSKEGTGGSQSPVTSENLTISGNTLNGNIGSIGTGISFWNHNGSATVKPLINAKIGGSDTDKNTFSANLANYIVLDATPSGDTQTAFFGTLYDITQTASNKTNIFPFNGDIDASYNVFGGVNTGTETDFDALLAVKTKIADGVDDPLTGYVNIQPNKAFIGALATLDNALNVVPDDFTLLLKNDVGVYGALSNRTVTKAHTFSIDSYTTGEITFGDLTINAPSKEVVFAQEAKVGGNFTLTAGKVTPSAGLTLEGTVTTTPDISNFINGAVTVNNVNSDVLIPIGKDGKAAYIELTGTSGASSTFTAEYFPAAHTSSAKGTGLTSVSGNEYWYLNRTSGDLSAKVKLYTFDLVASGLPLGTLGDAVVAQYIGGQWEAQGQGSLSVASPYHVAAGITSSTFGEFTFGSTTTVLPIELLSFTANVTTGGALVKWSTAKEENNAKFEIEKSFDGKNFFVIDSRKGQGNSSTISNYEFLDVSFKQSAYYRLVQVDAGGKRKVYDDLTKFVKGLDNSLSVVAYPNPVATKLYVTVGSANKENVKLLLSDLTGKTLKVKTADSSQPIELDVAGIATGSYILQVIKDSGNVSKKILKL